jgi:hypothetical protein
MIPDIEAALWHDRGLRWAMVAIALTAIATIYVMATSNVMTPLIPLLGSIAALGGRSQRSASALRACALVAMGLFTWLGMASVGLFFVPGVIAMIVAVVRT